MGSQIVYAKPQGGARVVFRPPSLAANLFDITIANVDGSTGQYIQVGSTSVRIFLVAFDGTQTEVDWVDENTGVVDFTQLYFLTAVDIALFGSNNQVIGYLREPAILTGYISNQVYTGGLIQVEARYLFDENDFIDTTTKLENVYFQDEVLATVDPPRIFFDDTNIVINTFLSVFATYTVSQLSTAAQIDSFLVQFAQTISPQGIVFGTGINNVISYGINFEYATVTFTQNPESGTTVATLGTTMLQFLATLGPLNTVTVTFNVPPSLPPPPVDPFTQNCANCFKSKKRCHKKTCHKQNCRKTRYMRN